MKEEEYMKLRTKKQQFFKLVTLSDDATRPYYLEEIISLFKYAQDLLKDKEETSLVYDVNNDGSVILSIAYKKWETKEETELRVLNDNSELVNDAKKTLRFLIKEFPEYAEIELNKIKEELSKEQENETI